TVGRNAMIRDLPAFLLISFVVIAVPGPDTALTIRNSLLHGRAGGMWTAVGVSMGQSVWAVATSAGVSAILRSAEIVFTALKRFGAAYLMLLGVQSLR